MLSPKVQRLPSRCDKELYNCLQSFRSVTTHSLLSHCCRRFSSCLGNDINASRHQIAMHLNVQPVCVGENEFKRMHNKDAHRQQEIA